jgi:hypothetical protein
MKKQILDTPLYALLIAEGQLSPTYEPNYDADHMS